MEEDKLKRCRRWGDKDENEKRTWRRVRKKSKRRKRRMLIRDGLKGQR